MQGRSFAPLLKGDSQEDWRKTQLYTYWGAPEHFGVRSDRYTYVKIGGHEPELFDRREDPRQLQNVFASSEHSDAIKWLESQLWQQLSDVEIDQAEIPGNRKLRKKANR